MIKSLKNSLLIAGLSMSAIITVGTVGYFSLAAYSDPPLYWPLADCFYMTVITLTTVGFGEIIDVASVPGARFFTVFILLSGLGVSAYFISTITAFLVEGELKNLFWRKQMKKEIDKLTGHIVLCGGGRVGHYILSELLIAGSKVVLVEGDEKKILELHGHFGPFPAVIGDATMDEHLSAAGVEKAAGVISALSDDKDNLCVVVTCRQLNPDLRIISRCRSRAFARKLEMLGADVVMPNFIGGLRMASQMIRPRVVRYLDTMLRDKEYVVRIEEFVVEEKSDLAGSKIGAIDFRKYGNLLLLAVMEQEQLRPSYNPDAEYTIKAGDTLVFQAEAEVFAAFRKKHSFG